MWGNPKIDRPLLRRNAAREAVIKQISERFTKTDSGQEQNPEALNTIRKELSQLAEWKASLGMEEREVYDKMAQEEAARVAKARINVQTNTFKVKNASDLTPALLKALGPKGRELLLKSDKLPPDIRNRLEQMDNKQSRGSIWENIAGWIIGNRMKQTGNSSNSLFSIEMRHQENTGETPL